MTQENSAFGASSSLATEIQRRYGLSEERARMIASDPEFADYFQSTLSTSRISSTLLSELQAATKELEDLLSRMSAG